VIKDQNSKINYADTELAISTIDICIPPCPDLSPSESEVSSLASLSLFSTSSDAMEVGESLPDGSSPYKAPWLPSSDVATLVVLQVLLPLRVLELGESRISLIMKEVRVVVGAEGVLPAAFPLGVKTVGEELELDAAPEPRTVGRLLALVQRAAASGLMPKLNAGLVSDADT